MKHILFFLFPVPDKTPDSGTAEHHFSFKWLISALFFGYFYFRLMVDAYELITYQVQFDRAFDFFVYNNHLAATLAFSSLVLGILLLHILIRVQELAPRATVDKAIFNITLAGFFMLGLYFKGIEIDALVGEILIDSHQASMQKSFAIGQQQNHFKKMRELMARGEFDERAENYELLCDLGHVDACMVFSSIYSEQRGYLYYWSLRRTIKLEPKHAQALNNISWSLMVDPEYNQSVKYLNESLAFAQRAVEIHPENHFYNDTLAMAYFMQKDCQRAQTHETLALKYLKDDQVRAPSSTLVAEYKDRLNAYQECQGTK